MDELLVKNFESLDSSDLELIDGGFVIQIWGLKIAGAALAKAAGAIGAAYMAGYTLGQHTKKKK